MLHTIALFAVGFFVLGPLAGIVLSGGESRAERRHRLLMTGHDVRPYSQRLADWKAQRLSCLTHIEKDLTT